MIDRWDDWRDAVAAEFVAWVVALQGEQGSAGDHLVLEFSPGRPYLDLLMGKSMGRYLHMHMSVAGERVLTEGRDFGAGADAYVSPAAAIAGKVGALALEHTVALAGLGLAPSTLSALTQVALEKQIPLFLVAEDAARSSLQAVLARLAKVSQADAVHIPKQFDGRRVYDVIRVDGREALIQYALELFPEVDWHLYAEQLELELQPFCQMDGTWIVPSQVVVIQHPPAVVTH